MPPVPTPGYGIQYTYVILGVLAVLIVGAFFLYQTSTETSQSEQNTQAANTTQPVADANAALDAAIPADSEADFQAVDADISQL